MRTGCAREVWDGLTGLADHLARASPPRFSGLRMTACSHSGAIPMTAAALKSSGLGAGPENTVWSGVGRILFRMGSFETEARTRNAEIYPTLSGSFSAVL